VSNNLPRLLLMASLVFIRVGFFMITGLNKGDIVLIWQ